MESSNQGDNLRGVAHLKEMCPLCERKETAYIMVSVTDREDHSDFLQKMHGGIIRTAAEPCDQCKQFMKDGIIVIGVKSKECKEGEPPVRTGHFAVVKEEAFDAMKDTLDLSRRVLFMDAEEGIRVGIFKRHDEEEQEEENDGGSEETQAVVLEA